jgi:RNA polymerase sigma factor (sigma-70 family)
MNSQLNELVRCLDEHREDTAPTDRELLRLYARERDEDAFALLVRRHGGLVWGVCQRALPRPDAEDVYQATFLVLARKAGATAWCESVGPWLHAVATRLARKVRTRSRRSEPLHAAPEMFTQEDPLAVTTARELLVALDEELAALPARHAGPVLLCLVEGKTQNEAARLLGVSLSAVRRRLQAGRDRLARRLQRRGLSPTVLALPALSTGAAPAVLPVASLSARVVALAEAIAQSASTGLRVTVAALLLLGAVGLGFGLAAPRPRPDDPPREVGQPPVVPAVPVWTGRDQHNDPLPAEALARLGTVRLRVGSKPTTMVFAPGSRVLASIAPGNGLRLWDVPSGKEIGHLPDPQSTFVAAAFSPDGKRIAVTSDRDVIVHAVRDNPPSLGDELCRFQSSPAAPLKFVAFRRDGLLVTGADDARMAVHNATGKELRAFGNVTPSHTFALSPDDKTLVLSAGKDVTLYTAEQGAMIRGLPGVLKVPSLAFSPDGKLLALGDETNTIRLWDIATSTVVGKLIGVKGPGQLRGVGDEIHSLCFTPDSSTLISAGDYGDGTVRIWDVATGKQTGTLQGNFGDSYCVAVAPDGKTVAVGGANGTLRLWDLATKKVADADLGTQCLLTAVAVDPSGREIATAGNDGMIYMWDPSGKLLRQWRAHERQIGTLAYGRESGKLFSTGAYSPARYWDSTTGKKLQEYAGSTMTVIGVNFLTPAPDGKRLIVAGNNQELQLTDAATGKVEKVVAQGLIDRAWFSPDGKLLAGGGFDKQVHLWELATGKEKWAVPLPTSVAAVSFAPDGKSIAIGTYDKQVLIFDSATGQLLFEPGGRTQTVRTVAYSPDGRLIAAAGDTNDVTLYEVATHRPVRKLEGHRGHVWSLAFTPDSRALVTASFDGTALVWDVAGQRAAKQRQKPPSDAELDACWPLLGKADSVEGYDVTLLLASVPDRAAALLQTRLLPTPVAPKMIARWLADLDDEDFDVRERASGELARLGKSIEAELRKTRTTTKSPEVGKRLDALLKDLDDGSNETVRMRRALAVLELAGTPETRKVLERLAREGPSDELRQQSRQALDRLSRRP